MMLDYCLTNEKRRHVNYSFVENVFSWMILYFFVNRQIKRLATCTQSIQRVGGGRGGGGGRGLKALRVFYY